MWDPIIEGCTTSTACNYNPEAKEDDNSCIDPLGCDNWCPDDTTEVKELDCADICGGIQFIDCSGLCGILVEDECGVCGGNNYICTDCNGVVNGEAKLDNCGDCVGGNTGLEACDYDCTGYWGGDAEIDQCGICGGDNSTCTDCNGNINGIAYTDGCGECVGGNTTLDACLTDCAGIFDGTSDYDNCDICVSEGDTSCVQSCDGSWVNDGSQLILDECNVCGGDNTVCAGCMDTLASNYDVTATIDSGCSYGVSGQIKDSQGNAIKDVAILLTYDLTHFVGREISGQNMPITFINFVLSVEGEVLLWIEDVCGDTMAVLVDEILEAGNHSVIWDAAGLLEGNYKLHLITSETNQTQNLLLLPPISTVNPFSSEEPP